MPKLTFEELILPPDTCRDLIQCAKPGDTYVWLTGAKFSIVLSYGSTLKDFILFQRSFGTVFIASEVTITKVNGNSIYGVLIDLLPEELDTFCYQ